MTLRIRFPEREDSLRGNVEIVDDQDQRIALGHLEVDEPLNATPGHPVAATLRFVGHVE